MIFNGFVGPTYENHSLNVDAQRCINWYPELVESGTGKSRYAYHPTPGFTQVVDTEETLRGLFVVRPEPISDLGALPYLDRLFSTHDGRLVEFTDPFDTGTLTMTDRGEFPTPGGTGDPVTFASNGQELIMSNKEGEVYLFDLTSHVLSGPISNVTGWLLGFIDGFFVAANSTQFQISGLYDGSTWNPLDFATPESSPDGITDMLIDHGEIVIGGVNTIQFWRNTGAADFPFAPVHTVEYGVLQGTMKRQDNSVFFVGSDDRGGFAVYRLNGYQPQRISTHAIEERISQPGRPFKGRAFTYSERGHSFYVLVNVSRLGASADETSLVYDCATQLWHERGTHIGGDSFEFELSSTGVIEAQTGFQSLPVLDHVFAFGKHLVNPFNGGLCEMSNDAYEDELLMATVVNPQKRIVRLRRGPYLTNERKRVLFQRMELDIETGEGNDNDPEPEVRLRWSDNGGKTYGNYVTARLGREGEYDHDVVFHRLGSGSNRVFEVSTIAKTKVSIANAYIEVKAARH